MQFGSLINGKSGHSISYGDLGKQRCLMPVYDDKMYQRAVVKAYASAAQFARMYLFVKILLMSVSSGFNVKIGGSPLARIRNEGRVCSSDF